MCMIFSRSKCFCGKYCAADCPDHGPSNTNRTSRIQKLYALSDVQPRQPVSETGACTVALLDGVNVTVTKIRRRRQQRPRAHRRTQSSASTCSLFQYPATLLPPGSSGWGPARSCSTRLPRTTLIAIPASGDGQLSAQYRRYARLAPTSTTRSLRSRSRSRRATVRRPSAEASDRRPDGDISLVSHARIAPFSNLAVVATPASAASKQCVFDAAAYLSSKGPPGRPASRPARSKSPPKTRAC